MSNKSYYNQKLKKYARSLHKNQTNVEFILWSKSRARQLGGYKFKRQFPINNYIIDFYCHNKKLGIELDGSQHSEHKQKEYDMKRTFLLSQRGISLIRFWDTDVIKNIEGVLEEIFNRLQIL